MERKIEKDVVVDAPVGEVWRMWTTEAGAKTFFAPKANIDLTIGGRYEILFDLDAPPGSQGGEGLKVLAYTPERMLAVEWNAPPHLPNVRRERTRVIVEFSSRPERKTGVRLTHDGWGQGGEWDQAFNYFVRAWDVVLGRLKHRFSIGPIDWANPYRPVAESNPIGQE
jgi:uncharacterized protein YndB with AHSA1/START domain